MAVTAFYLGMDSMKRMVVSPGLNVVLNLLQVLSPMPIFVMVRWPPITIDLLQCYSSVILQENFAKLVISESCGRR